MANGDQVKALLRAYKEADETQLLTLALQIAAKEAKAGHSRLAEDIRKLVDEVRARAGMPPPSRRPTPITQPKGELAELVNVGYPDINLNDLVLNEDTQERLQRVLREQRQSSRIREFGLEPRRKLLLLGPPGTGKTMTASAIAGELSLPLFTLRLESFFTRYMGEAASRLKLVFDNIQQVRGVYLFDEFDAIGQNRGSQNDIGEARRILNSFLQLIEQDRSQSILLSATNHPQLLDAALFRRFDDVLRYELPDTSSIIHMLQRRLSRVNPHLAWDELSKAALGLSYADLAKVCDDATKEAIIFGELEILSDHHIHQAISQRKRDRKNFSDYSQD